MGGGALGGPHFSLGAAAPWLPRRTAPGPTTKKTEKAHVQNVVCLNTVTAPVMHKISDSYNDAGVLIQYSGVVTVV